MKNWIKTHSVLIAITLTALFKFIFMDWLNWRLIFTVFTCLGWGFYVFTKRTEFYNWGFRKDNFIKTLKMVVPFGLCALLLSVTVGYGLGTLNLTWHIIPILIIYPIWGIVQQFLITGLIVGELQKLKLTSGKTALICFITAVLFAGVHFPHYWLVIGTFVLSLFYSWVYQKERNLWVLGIFHGWLGAVFFYSVVERDPFLEMFGTFLN